jgi:hypothetical protein
MGVERVELFQVAGKLESCFYLVSLARQASPSRANIYIGYRNKCRIWDVRNPLKQVR